MKSVPQSSAPLDYDVFTNYFIVLADNITGGNGTYYAPDSVTIKGGVVILNKDFSNQAMADIGREELTSMLMGGVESDNFYDSIYDRNRGGLFPQDIRRQQWIIYRGPGRQFPDLPKNFNPR